MSEKFDKHVKYNVSKSFGYMKASPEYFSVLIYI